MNISPSSPIVVDKASRSAVLRFIDDSPEDAWVRDCPKAKTIFYDALKKSGVSETLVAPIYTMLGPHANIICRDFADVMPLFTAPYTTLSTINIKNESSRELMSSHIATLFEGKKVTWVVVVISVSPNDASFDHLYSFIDLFNSHESSNYSFIFADFVDASICAGTTKIEIWTAYAD